MVDWEKLKTEYVTTDITQRELCKKYGINRGNLGTRASREDWAGQRAAMRSKRTEQAIKAASKVQARQIQAQANSEMVIHEASTKLASLIKGFLETQEPDTVDVRDLRTAAIALREVQDIQHIKSPEDLAEQKARIENLRRQADTSRESTIEVVWGEMPPEGDG